MTDDISFDISVLDEFDEGLNAILRHFEQRRQLDTVQAYCREFIDTYSDSWRSPRKIFFHTWRNWERDDCGLLLHDDRALVRRGIAVKTAAAWLEVVVDLALFGIAELYNERIAAGKRLVEAIGNYFECRGRVTRADVWTDFDRRVLAAGNTQSRVGEGVDFGSEKSVSSTIHGHCRNLCYAIDDLRLFIETLEPEPIPPTPDPSNPGWEFRPYPDAVRFSDAQRHKLLGKEQALWLLAKEVDLNEHFLLHSGSTKTGLPSVLSWATKSEFDDDIQGWKTRIAELRALVVELASANTNDYFNGIHFGIDPVTGVQYGADIQIDFGNVNLDAVQTKDTQKLLTEAGGELPGPSDGGAGGCGALPGEESAHLPEKSLTPSPRQDGRDSANIASPKKNHGRPKDADPKADDALPAKQRKLAPSRIKAQALYEWAMSAIPGADDMTIVELYDAIEIHPGIPADEIPPSAETFGKYLRDAGVKRYGKRAEKSTGTVHRPDDV